MQRILLNAFAIDLGPLLTDVDMGCMRTAHDAMHPTRLSKAQAKFYLCKPYLCDFTCLVKLITLICTNSQIMFEMTNLTLSSLNVDMDSTRDRFGCTCQGPQKVKNGRSLTGL